LTLYLSFPGMTATAAQIASLLDATLEGNPSATVTQLAPIETAGPGDFAFLDNIQYEHFAYTTQASVLLVSTEFKPSKPIASTLLRAKNVRESLAILLEKFHEARQTNYSVTPEYSFIDPSAKVGGGTTIGAFSVIEADAVIGQNCIIYPQVYIGRNVRIGNNVRLYPGVKIHYDCIIGDNCIVHANAVIGADGFGYIPNADKSWKKVPQVGIVVLEEKVEIGASTCIDRATMGKTVVHTGAKIDNLVHIAHNVHIGEHTAIAAQVGVAGSAQVGAHNQIGGQAGISGHITLADGTRIQAQSGIASSIKEPDSAVFGSPAIGYKDYIRSYAVFKKLPELERQIARLQKQLDELRVISDDLSH
jgi:UDP-3-O-[3-hydroxymyristoyl] glucosamine N-acyltransferase